MRLRSWLRHYATRRQEARSIPDEVTGFFFLSKLPTPSSHIIALVFTQPLTEMIIMNLAEGKARLARQTDNLTAICEPTL
jgi:hypothetical protein